MELELLPVSVPRPLKRKQPLNGRPQKKSRCETFSDKTLGDETLSEHPEGCDYPQSDDSEASCSTSTDSGSHDSDSPSWMQDADFEHECDIDYQWDHHTHQCDHTEVETMRSYTLSSIMITTRLSLKWLRNSVMIFEW